MLCVNCGRDNREETFFCESCGKRLPDRSLYTVMATPKIIDSKVKLMQSLCDSVKKEEISLEEFGTKISSTYDSIAADAEEIREVAKTDDYESYSSEEMDIGYRGLELWMAGLTELYSYTELLDPDLLKTGMRKIAEGNDFINKAIYFNELKRDTEGSSGKI